MSKLVRMAALGGIALALTACNEMDSSGGSPPVTGNLCEVNEPNVQTVAAACEEGDRVLFAPRTFGNAQLPVVFASLHCDHSQSIALTEGGVSCIYSPADLDEEDQVDQEGADLPE